MPHMFTRKSKAKALKKGGMTMAGETIVTIVGNTTAPADLRFTSSGKPVASFTVASTPRTLNRQTNQWEDGEAMFVRCSAWEAHAENVAETLVSKGMRVVVTGRMTVRSYEHNGQQRTSIEMQVDEVGPSLRYARAQVVKTPRGQNTSQASQDRFSGPQSTNGYPGGAGQFSGSQGGVQDPAGNLANVQDMFNQQQSALPPF